MEVLQGAGGVIAAVEPGSVAARVGIQPGWRLLRINGHPIRDLIDYRFYSADTRLRLEVDDGTTVRTFRVQLWEDEDLGLEFATPTFDDITRCRNKCPFCFLKGLPRGLRRSLYIKDDDYRYSFLFGNFITLTNLTEADWERIETQRLSPLYVSVHATDRAARNRLLGLTDAPDILAQIDRLGRAGLQVHTQLVICPGLNDGEILEQSITDLAQRYPTVQSIAVVPVGLTHRNLSDAVTGLRLLTEAEMAAIVDRVEAYAARFRREFGVSLVYAADEYYLRLGRRLPSAAAYDGYPQYQNGVGMVRALLEDWRRLKARLTRRPPEPVPSPLRYTLVCGTLIAPVLQQIVAELAPLVAGRAELELVPVVNRFFGESVTVSGLLTGADLAQTFGPAGQPAGDVIVLPHWMFDATGTRTLDGQTPAGLEATLRRPLLIAESLADLVAGLGQRPASRRSPVAGPV